MIIVEVVTFSLWVFATITATETGDGRNIGNTTEEGIIPRSGTLLQQAEITSSVGSTVGASGKTGDTSVVRFTNVNDGQVMTVDGDHPIPHLNISARFWNNSDGQKWLLIPKGDVYLILPKRQHAEWANFLRRTSQRGSDNLPAVTLVVGIDVMNGGITQQILHGRSNQHWEFKSAKEGRILISSPARGKCISEKKLEGKKPGLLQRAKDKITGVFGSKKPDEKMTIEPVQLVAVDCDDADPNQLWRAEPVTK